MRSNSKFNIHCLDHMQCQSIGRPRQNSVFVGSSISCLGGNTPRRTKSAFDIQSLVSNEKIDNNNDNIIDNKIDEIDKIEKLHNDNIKLYNDFPKQSRSFQRERGMSICPFDRTDVLARPLQRERGMSICHFDRMDVLAHPTMPRERGMSICHFDRMDVLARPSSVFRGSKSSVFSNMEKIDSMGRSIGQNYQRGSRASIGNFEASARFLQQRIKDRAQSLGKNVTQRVNNNGAIFERPSCSKTPDVVLGYKATCV
uniref:Fibronectin type III domain-containing protein n=1 Tax=Bracon brevicornis TaxID=1563983 RepID=A0A6V7LI12_9HYME